MGCSPEPWDWLRSPEPWDRLELEQLFTRSEPEGVIPHHQSLTVQGGYPRRRVGYLYSASPPGGLGRLVATE